MRSPPINFSQMGQQVRSFACGKVPRTKDEVGCFRFPLSTGAFCFTMPNPLDRMCFHSKALTAFSFMWTGVIDWVGGADFFRARASISFLDFRQAVKKPGSTCTGFFVIFRKL